MAKHLIDSDLYIDLIQSGTTLPVIRELYEADAPGIYFSSIVAQELLAGAQSPAGKRRVEELLRPFEKVGRVITPNHNQWKDAGSVLAKILHDRKDLRSKLPALVNFLPRFSDFRRSTGLSGGQFAGVRNVACLKRPHLVVLQRDLTLRCGRHSRRIFDSPQVGIRQNPVDLSENERRFVTFVIDAQSEFFC